MCQWDTFIVGYGLFMGFVTNLSRGANPSLKQNVAELLYEEKHGTSSCPLLSFAKQQYLHALTANFKHTIKKLL